MSTSGDPNPDEIRVDAHQPDEIVVATPHAREVLAELGTTAVLADSDARLGLSKLLLRDAAAAGARFRAELQDGPRLPLGSGVFGAQMRADSEVERVLAGLRVRFATRWQGWVPVLGKNRVVLGGEGVPYMTIRSADIPEPATADAFAQVPAATEGGAALRIGVLDTPVAEHEDFSDQLVPGSTRLSAPRPWPFRLGHGTFLAGLLTRYAPQSRIDVRGVLGGPLATATAWDVAVGLVDLVDAGADLVSMSIGCFTLDSQPPLVLQTAVQMVRDQALLVAASGNHGRQTGENGVYATSPLWPAALDGVITVGGSRDGATHLLAGFTPPAPWVQLLAPGENLVSTYVQGPVSLPPRDHPTAREGIELFEGFATWSGSSMATAVATGCLASAASVRLKDGPVAGPAERRVALRKAVDDALDGRDPAGVLVPFSVEETPA